jgi:hypothetical protein
MQDLSLPPNEWTSPPQQRPKGTLLLLVLLLPPAVPPALPRCLPLLALTPGLLHGINQLYGYGNRKNKFDKLLYSTIPDRLYRSLPPSLPPTLPFNPVCAALKSEREAGLSTCTSNVRLTMSLNRFNRAA